MGEKINNVLKGAGRVPFYDTFHRDQTASMDAQRICTG